MIGETDEVRIVVIILTMNQKERTRQCLSNLSSIDSPTFQVLLWDNGSTDNTLEMVKTNFPDVTGHRYPTNLGVASGRNAAAEMAVKMFQPTYLLFLDNDILVEPEFVSALLEPFMKNHIVGQTQAKLRFMDDKQRLNDGGGAQVNFFSWRVTPVGFGEIDHGQYDSVKPCIACGGAMMVRTDVFQKLGGFDPIFDPFGPEDIDFSLRLQKSGHISLFVPQAVAYHAVSHSFGSDYSEEYAHHKVRHWLLFMRRHASLGQRSAFYIFGAPLLAIRVFAREIKRGNIGAVRGLLRGILNG